MKAMTLNTLPDTVATSAAIKEWNITVTDESNAVISKIETLIGTALDASERNPLLNLPSIFGPVRTWFSPFARNGYSEFKIIDLWRLRRTLKYLVNTLIPSIPLDPPPFGPSLLNNIFWHPTVILQRPDHNGSYTSFPEEVWFFINGIMTNDSIAQLNAAYLASLFHRPLTLIQNSTDSLLIDLFECLMGRDWEFEQTFNGWDMTESAIKAFPPIYEALTNPQKKKVVVVAHSQGTIIMAYVLRLLKGQWPETEGMKMLQPKKSRVVAVGPEQWYTPAEPVFVYPDQTPLKPSDFRPLAAEELAKLEIYCFANCARQMTYFDNEARVPWIESVGNEHDLVARLGMLAPHPEERQIAIDGPRYLHKDTWGHLLNVHYLYDIDKHEQGKGRQPGGSGDGTFKGTLQLLNTDQFPDKPTPRLFKYINGGHPSPLSPPQ